MTRRADLTAWAWPAGMAALGALLGLVAVIEPLVAIGGAVAIVFVALVVADLTLGVALFMFVAFLDVLPGVGGLSAAKLAGMVLVMSWLAVSATSPRHREQLSQVHPWVIAAGAVFVTWVAASALWAEESAVPLEAVTRWIPNLLLVPIVFVAVHDRRDLRLMVGAFVAGALLSTFYGAFIAAGDIDAAEEGRVSGAGTDPNYLAATLVASLALCGGAVATRAYSVGVRVAALGAAVLLLVALVATASRTGIIALVVAVLAAMVVAGRGRRLPMLLAAVAVLGAGALYTAAAAPREVRERLTDIAGSGGTGRTDIWTVGWRMARDKPLHGVGAGNFPISSVHYLLEPGALKRDDFIVDNPKVAHNVYLEVWAELGLVGLALFLPLVLFPLWCGLRAARAFARAGDRAMDLLARSVVVAMIAMLTAAFFNSMEYDKQIWLMLALGPCLLAVARREGRLA